MEMLLAKPFMLQQVDWFEAMRFAIRYNAASIANIFLELSLFDPSSNNQLLIVEACEHGSTQCVIHLLADHRVDPSARNQWPIITAIVHIHVY